MRFEGYIGTPEMMEEMTVVERKGLGIELVPFTMVLSTLRIWISIINKEYISCVCIVLKFTESRGGQEMTLRACLVCSHPSPVRVEYNCVHLFNNPCYCHHPSSTLAS